MLNNQEISNIVILPPPRQLATLKQKIDWLKINKESWINLKYIENPSILNPVIKMMKNQNLYSKKTSNRDIVRHLVKILDVLLKNQETLN